MMQTETLAPAPRTLALSVRMTKPVLPRLAVLGIVLIAVGVSLAGYATIKAIQIHDEDTMYKLLIISGLVLALTGLLFVIHTQRKNPESQVPAGAQC